VLVAAIFLFLGLELLARLMRPREPQEPTEEPPEIWYDTFGKLSAYALTAVLLLFLLVCVAAAVALLLG
jgi:hypothetical protein